ncbi:type II toxin-antitoxin system VapC family toxin [Aeromicrobium sp. CTD01-1L150]|uniref:type II toxin-antitoxin system VapC family toxin n=1 Tax=Aeromicrobium sp. CTD01-1L150 TaxID=3341830 RepID=UPI0035BF05F1
MPLIDANVLIYARGMEHSLKEPCSQIITAIHQGHLRASATVETLQEFAHAFARRRGRRVSAQVAQQYSVVLAPLRTTEPDHLIEGLELWHAHESLGCFDAVLAAIALDSKDPTIVSADRAFADVPGLRHVYPDADGVASLLG